MNQTCGCCEGLEPLTPLATANRPGLNALAYRAGTHATFLETMKARLSAKDYPALDGLTTRAETDPSIALLDAWATVADVLTFYQERIANEGYLCTATERRSILELARLVGYTLRPGVAASVYLAFTLREDYNLEVPAGTRAQSLPGPGQLPQSFETAENLEARADWNNLKPRMTRPQTFTSCNQVLYFKGLDTNLQLNDPLLIESNNKKYICRVADVVPEPEADRTKVSLQAWSLPNDSEASERRESGFVSLPENLRADPLRELVNSLGQVTNLTSEDLQERVPKLADTVHEAFRALAKMPASSDRERAVELTRTALEDIQRALGPITERRPRSVLTDNVDKILRWIHDAMRILETDNGSTPQDMMLLDDPIDHLFRTLRSAGGATTRMLKPARDFTASFSRSSDAPLRLLTSGQPDLEQALYTALGTLEAEQVTTPKVFAFRTTASLFGHNAPILPKFDNGVLKPGDEWDTTTAGDEKNDSFFLDNAYDQILPGEESYIVVQHPTGTDPNKIEGFEVSAYNIKSVVTRSRAAYGISGKTTQITLKTRPDWWDPGNEDQFHIIRGTVVYAQSEELTLAEEPIAEPVKEDSIELEGIYDGLQPGRWLIVSGEIVDVPDVSGIVESEPVMLAEVEQPGKPSDAGHSKLLLVNGLVHKYKRDTVTIYGNVVRATHGETRTEVLGSGDASEGLQRFSLKQSPLTYVAATTPTGIESTLEVYVNDIRRHEAERLIELEPSDRRFITRTGEQDETTIFFGDGEHGARLPTGVENVRTTYRTGIGKAGNVAARQISLLATQLLGLDRVINPRPATGGADREPRDQARRNAPLAVMALDRLVSVQDYEDFARAFAGIGKASAVRLSDGRQQLVHLTIAGADDIPIDEGSDLYWNLVQALRRFGDPYQPLRVEVRELKLLLISATVSLLPDYLWESVEPKIRAALLDTFSFERRELGQDAVLSEVISAIQQVDGVAYVDVDTFGGIPEMITGENGQRRLLSSDEIVVKVGGLEDSQKDGPLQRVPVDLAGSAGNSIHPAQLAFLTPRVPETLILKEITA